MNTSLINLLPLWGIGDKMTWLKDSNTKINSGSQWISANDRLPDAGKRVLIGSTVHDVVGKARKGFNCWIICASNDRVPNSEVTHWMPLPEPPTNEGGE